MRTQFSDEELERAARQAGHKGDRGRGFLWLGRHGDVDGYILAFMEEVERRRKLGESDHDIASALELL
jgi:hypothetical protein